MLLDKFCSLISFVMISFVADKFWKDKFCGDKFSDDMFCMGSILLIIIDYHFTCSSVQLKKQTCKYAILIYKDQQIKNPTSQAAEQISWNFSFISFKL